MGAVASAKSKEFWKLLSGAKPQKSSAQAQITATVWETYWQHLYATHIDTQRDIDKYERSICPTLPSPHTTPTPRQHEFAPITEPKIRDAIARVPKGKTPGAELVLPKMFSNPSHLLISAFQMLFNRCISSNTFPKQWSDVSIVPIYKAGVRGDPANYRPISLVSTTAKIYMSILQRRPAEWAATNQVIKHEQTAFQPGMGSAEQIFILSSLIHDIRNKPGQQVCAMFADLKKAFDSVNHARLWAKLRLLGVPHT